MTLLLIKPLSHFINNFHSQRTFPEIFEMKTIISALVIILLASCSTNGPAGKKLTGCDSLVISFNAPNSDSIVSMVSTTEKKAIRKLAGFLNGKEAEQYKCGYDGSMVFYKDGQEIMPALFKFSEEGCRHFLFDINNKLTSTRMSNEEVSFLQSLKEGRPWY